MIKVKIYFPGSCFHGKYVEVAYLGYLDNQVEVYFYGEPWHQKYWNFMDQTPWHIPIKHIVEIIHE